MAVEAASRRGGLLYRTYRTREPGGEGEGQVRVHFIAGDTAREVTSRRSSAPPSRSWVSRWRTARS
jgi:hypothetical protein